MKILALRITAAALFTLICSPLLIGCASMGNVEISMSDRVSQIQPGKSSKSDVRRLVGDPSSVNFIGEDKEIWSYIYSSSSLRATHFIPIVNLVAGGVSTKTNNLQVYFKDDIVQKVGAGQMSGGVGSLLDSDALKRASMSSSPSNSTSDTVYGSNAQNSQKKLNTPGKKQALSQTQGSSAPSAVPKEKSQGMEPIQ
jgi:outer membrane protein assembly factor BamE (lipoprotein component of BamABCDE complex)